MNSLLGPGQEGVAVSSRHWMHQHPAVAAALHRARTSTCSAVMRTPPDAGLHSHQHVHVDSAALFEELTRSADYLVQALLEDVPGGCKVCVMWRYSGCLYGHYTAVLEYFGLKRGMGGSLPLYNNCANMLGCYDDFHSTYFIPRCCHIHKPHL